MKEIIINKNEKKETVIALIENGKLIEKYEEVEGQNRLEGNIYLGKVQNILLGMQAAFIDIGEKKNTFIHIKDIIPKISDETGNKNEQFNKYNIKQYIRINDPILVQVKRDSTDKKGARVSTHVSLPGRFVVLMPEVNFITVSQKIESIEERKRLIEIVEHTINHIKIEEKFGIIVRTAAESKSEQEIEEDITKVIETYEKIKKEEEKIKEEKLDFPKLIFRSRNLVQKTVVDLMDQGIEKITVNQEETKNQVKELIEEAQKEEIELIFQEGDLLNKYELEKQLQETKNRKLWLKCGGFITIDKTEALTAIDVNSGKYTGGKSLDQTIYTVNKEATIEIAKQLRLRDIGGIIIIDYIDMENKEDKKKILELLKERLKEDRSKTQIVGFTQLDLLEMTRKHICSNEE